MSRSSNSEIFVKILVENFGSSQGSVDHGAWDGLNFDEEGSLIKFWLIPSLQLYVLFYVFGRNNDSKIYQIQKSRPDVPSRNRGYPTVFIIAYMYSINTSTTGFS